MHHQYRRITLRWRHNRRDCVSNHQPHDCLLNRLFKRRSKKTSKLRVTGFCAGKSPGTGEFPAQMASNAENVSIWWRHHDAPRTIRHLTHNKADQISLLVLMYESRHKNSKDLLPWITRNRTGVPVTYYPKGSMENNFSLYKFYSLSDQCMASETFV